MGTEYQQADQRRHIFQPTCVPGIELCKSQLRNCSLPKHMHEEYSLTVFDRGVGELAYRGRRELVGTTLVNVFAPGEVHAVACDVSWELRSAYLSEALVRQVADHLGVQLREGLYFRQNVISSVDLHSWFIRLFDALTGPVTQLSTDSILLSTLSCLIERFTDAQPRLNGIGKERTAVLQCRAFLESHYAEEVRLDTLAGISGISAFHLIRSFTRQFGIPPHAFQVLLRLNAAKAALRNGSTLAEAAVGNGFCDQSHLHRHFQRTFGVTPNDYRRSVWGSSAHLK